MLPGPLNFDVYRLRVFCAVVEHKSFTRAAQELLTTQPAVSLHVRALERAFHAPLLDRGRRQIVPTQAGATVYAFACDMLARMNETAQTVAEYASGTQGRLLLGASTSTGNYVLPAVVAEFRGLHQGAYIRMRVGTRTRILDGILTGDLQFGYVEVGDIPRGLRAERMHSEDLVFFVAAGHSLLSASELRIEHLREHDLVTGISGASYYAEQVSRQLQPLGLAPTPAPLEVGAPEATKRIVAASNAVGLLPRSAVAIELAQGELVELSLQGARLRMSYELVFPSNAERTPLASTFLDFIRSHLGAG
jgi:DNA-binding transcriptional LysR family regulator